LRRPRHPPAAYSIGSSTFFRAEARDSSSNDWKTKPIRWFRTRASSLERMRLTSLPARKYRPPLGRSRQPMMFISVLLPEPEGP
jgi:hypothetical protein